MKECEHKYYRLPVALPTTSYLKVERWFEFCIKCEHPRSDIQAMDMILMRKQRDAAISELEEVRPEAARAILDIKL